MAITLRLTKGSALTYSELDTNFSDLDTRVTTNKNNITTLNSSVSTLNTNVSNNDSDILSLQTEVDAIDVRLISAEGELSNVSLTSTIADFGSRKLLHSTTYDSAEEFPDATQYPGMILKFGGDGSNRLRFSNGLVWRAMPTTLTTIRQEDGDTIDFDSQDFTLNFHGGDGIKVTKVNGNMFRWSSDPSWSFDIVLADGDSGYAFRPDSRFFLDSDIDPTLYLRRGETYNFNLSAPSEPFYIKTAQSTGTGDQYTDGVTGNGTQFGTVTFQPPMNAPETLYYASSVSATHTGTIKIV